MIIRQKAFEPILIIDLLLLLFGKRYHVTNRFHDACLPLVLPHELGLLLEKHATKHGLAGDSRDWLQSLQFGGLRLAAAMALNRFTDL